MSGMRKTLNKDDRKKEEISDIRARDRLKEQNSLKRMNQGSQVRLKYLIGTTSMISFCLLFWLVAISLDHPDEQRGSFRTDYSAFPGSNLI